MPTTVSDLMTHPPLFVRSDASIRDAVTLLLREDAPQLDVVDERGLFVGSVPDCELLKAQMSGDDGAAVSSVMHTDAVRIDAEMTGNFAAALFCDGRLRRLPVVCNGQIVGQIDRRDLMRLIHANGHLEQPSNEPPPDNSRRIASGAVPDRQSPRQRPLQTAAGS